MCGARSLEPLGERLTYAWKVNNVLFHMDNLSDVYIKNSFFSTSPEIMDELRSLKLSLNHMDTRIRAEWLLPTLKTFSNALSGRLVSQDY